VQQIKLTLVSIARISSSHRRAQRITSAYYHSDPKIHQCPKAVNNYRFVLLTACSTRTMKPSLFPSKAMMSPLIASVKKCRYSAYYRSDWRLCGRKQDRDPGNLYYVKDSSQFLTYSTCRPNYGNCVGGSVGVL
jgi:hypothetical protein